MDRQPASQPACQIDTDGVGLAEIDRALIKDRRSQPLFHFCLELVSAGCAGHSLRRKRGKRGKPKEENRPVHGVGRKKKVTDCFFAHMCSSRNRSEISCREVLATALWHVKSLIKSFQFTPRVSAVNGKTIIINRPIIWTNEEKCVELYSVPSLNSRCANSF